MSGGPHHRPHCWPTTHLHGPNTVASGGWDDAPRGHTPFAELSHVQLAAAALRSTPNRPMRLETTLTNMGAFIRARALASVVGLVPRKTNLTAVACSGVVAGLVLARVPSFSISLSFRLLLPLLTLLLLGLLLPLQFTLTFCCALAQTICAWRRLLLLHPAWLSAAVPKRV